MAKRMDSKTYNLVMFRTEQDTPAPACEAMLRGVCTYTPAHWHHRKMRSQGGKHEPCNGLGVCDSCHRAIHANPAFSYARGFLLHSWEPPGKAPVYRRGEWVVLDNEGNFKEVKIGRD